MGEDVVQQQGIVAGIGRPAEVDAACLPRR